MSCSTGVAVRWRLPALAAAALALLAGLYTGLLLLGAAVPSPAVAVEQVHGPLMVFGFVGTLIALERAVALGARWGMLAPACSGAGGLVLVTTGPNLAGKTLLMVASVALLGIYRALWRRQAGISDEGKTFSQRGSRGFGSAIAFSFTIESY